MISTLLFSPQPFISVASTKTRLQFTCFVYVQFSILLQSGWCFAKLAGILRGYLTCQNVPTKFPLLIFRKQFISEISVRICQNLCIFHAYRALKIQRAV